MVVQKQLRAALGVRFWTDRAGIPKLNETRWLVMPAKPLALLRDEIGLLSSSLQISIANHAGARSMGLYEALVWSPAGLAAPAGVTFLPNSASYDADMAAWNELLPMLTTQMFEGRYIMAIIQARGSGTTWNDKAKNFQFKPTDDCLLAAYCVSARLGKPYTPGLCSSDYVKNMIAAAQTGMSVQDYRSVRRDSTDLFQVFQCSAKGTNLAFNGCLMLIRNYKRSGLPDIEATVKAAADMTQRDRFGWKGGVFPALINRSPGARPRGAGGWTRPRA